jgi:signal transduction histidine kinase
VEGEQSTDRFPSNPTNVRADADDMTARIRVLRAVADPSLSQLGVATLIHEVALRLSDGLSADAVALHLLDGDADQLSLRLLHGSKHGPHGRREISLGEGVIGNVAATGRPAVVDASSLDGASHFSGAAGLRAIVAVPIRCLGRVAGVLSVGRTGSVPFDDGDLSLVSIAADRIACAIERTRLVDAEQRARAHAESALRARDDFLSMASHELKTPMTSLVLLVQCLLKAEPKPGAGTELGRRLEAIERQVMRLAHLTEHLLDVSRINTSGVGLELGAVDLADVVRAAIARATDELAHSKSHVSLHVTTPVVGRWDQKRCEQMVTHLLSNAANYGEHRPIDVDVTSDAKTARITVRDQGVGIPLQYQRGIFDRYARAPDAKNVAGLGMGLWVVRRIAGALGGSVFVESAPGEGAAFTVELPLAGPSERATSTFATAM